VAMDTCSGYTKGAGGRTAGQKVRDRDVQS